MANNHLCTDNCFVARTAEKFAISCFVCEKKFNSKCFDLSSQPIMKLLSSAGNAIFMCQKCIERVTKLKSNHRRSTNGPTVHNTISRTNEPAMQSAHIDNQISRPDEENGILSNMMKMLQQMNENISKFSNTNEQLSSCIMDKAMESQTILETRLSSVMKILETFNTKIEQHLIEQRSAESKSDTLNIQKLDENPSSNNFPLSMSTKRTTKAISSHRNKSCTNSTNFSDPLNWSFTFNQPTSPKCSEELYQLLSSFEQNTWTAFDHLQHKLNAITDSVLNIETICKAKNFTNNQRLVSPVTNSVQLDTLAMVQKKCDAIEEKMQSVDSKLTTIIAADHHPWSEDPDNSVFSTQKNRMRLQTLMETSDLNGQQTHESTKPNEDDISTYPVIAEMLEIRPSNITDSITNVREPYLQNKMSCPAKYNSQPSSKSAIQQDIHISKLPTSTTCEDVERYITQRITMDSGNLRIHRLTKKHQDITKLTFLSFKIETNETIAESLLRNEFWPRHVAVNRWQKKSEAFPPLNSDRMTNSFLWRTEANNKIT